MSILAGPSVAALRGIAELWFAGGRAALSAATFGAFVAPPALALAVISRVVSRHRELAANRGAALLTGSPAALASALARLAGELERLPRADLRAVAPRDPFYLLPTDPREKGGVRLLWATHPRLEMRFSQLERMESALQEARPPVR